LNQNASCREYLSGQGWILFQLGVLQNALYILDFGKEEPQNQHLTGDMHMEQCGLEEWHIKT